jgi:tryptophan-rich sensory protein
LDVGKLIENLSWIEKVAGGVWVFLTILLLFAIFDIAKSQGGWKNKYVFSIIILIVFIWLYPFYTLGFQLIPGLIGNIAVGLIACFIVWFVWPLSRKAGLLTAPVIIWIFAATFYVSLLIQQNA